MLSANIRRSVRDQEGQLALSENSESEPDINQADRAASAQAAAGAARTRIRLPPPPPTVEMDSAGYRLVFGYGLAQRRQVSRFGRE